MDIQNFLDPMGGSGRGTIWDGGLGIMGMLVGPGFDLLSGNFMKKELSIVKKQNSARRMMYGPRIPHFPADLHGPGMPRYTHRALSNKGRLKSLRARVKSTRATLGAIGWAYTASWLFDIGQSILTPGISKTAARSNQELIMNEAPLDSGRAFTQRQRAMQAIYESQGAVGRSMIGQESSFLHM